MRTFDSGVGSTPSGSPGSLSVTGTPVASATVGAAYGFTVNASGGIAPRTFSVFSGSLPPGVTLNASTGVVSGTPTTAGAYSAIVIRATDNVGATANLAAFTITVAAAVGAALTIGGTPATTGTVGTAYTFTPTASGGTAPRTFTLQAGTLPAGLAINASTGAITGTPTAIGTASGLVIRVTDAVAATADLPAFSIAVAAGTMTAATLNIAQISLGADAMAASTLNITSISLAA